MMVFHWNFHPEVYKIDFYFVSLFFFNLINMKIYSYILMHDTGFAPCIEDDVLSLCCCKPKIRSSAKVGDYIVAFYGKSQSRKQFGHSLAYIAKITEKMDFREYFDNHEGRSDCIYRQRIGYEKSLEQIPNEFHDESHKKTDLGEDIV